MSHPIKGEQSLGSVGQESLVVGECIMVQRHVC